MAAGDDRQYGGNHGYDDQVDMYYSWDSTVNNHGNVREGDIVALWDKRRLLGVSVIERIEPSAAVKERLRCPDCHRSNIKKRERKEVRYRCQACGREFDQPARETIEVTEYRSLHDAAWTWLEDALNGDELRRLCKSPKSQLSMRELDWDAFGHELTRNGGGSAVERAIDRVLDAQSEDGGLGGSTLAQGHRRAFVRVRRGQSLFRKQLIAKYGDTCAFTGAAPERVLEAGHLYSYAALGVHYEHGGLLLRRDVHRLFDDGLLAVDPTSLQLDVADVLEPYPQYERLHGAQLQVRVMDRQVDWLERHWLEHRGAPRAAPADPLAVVPN